MIKIQAYQKRGIKTDKIEDEYEFCCWDHLYKWLGDWDGLNQCPDCIKKTRERLRKKGMLFKK